MMGLHMREKWRGAMTVRDPGVGSTASSDSAIEAARVARFRLLACGACPMPARRREAAD